MKSLVSQEIIECKILLLRGKKVLLDRDLAEFYHVKTKALNQAVRRNISRFPEEFMFRLNPDETAASRSQIVTLKRGENIKYRPYAFTEHGVLMLSSVLKSECAVQVNIKIMRAFIRLREMVAAHADFRRALETLERRVDVHDRQIGAALDAVKRLLDPPEKKTPSWKMGFVG